MPSRTSSGIPGSAIQKGDEQAADASGSALDSSSAEKGVDPRDVTKEQGQKGATSDSRSSATCQQSGAEQDALPRSPSEQPEMQGRVAEHLSDKRRTTRADSATAGAAPHRQSSRPTSDMPAAGSESRPRRAANSTSRGSRPQAQGAQDARIGQKERSTAHRAPQESKAPAPRSRRGDAALPHSLAPQSNALIVPASTSSTVALDNVSVLCGMALMPMCTAS